MTFVSLNRILIKIALSMLVASTCSAADRVLPHAPEWHNAQAVFYDYELLRNGVLEQSQRVRWAVFGPVPVENSDRTVFDFQVSALNSTMTAEITLIVPVIDHPFSAHQLMAVFQGLFSKLGTNVYYRVIPGETPVTGEFSSSAMSFSVGPYNSILAGMHINENISVTTTAGTFNTTLFSYEHIVGNNVGIKKMDFFSDLSVPVTGVVRFESIENVSNTSKSVDELKTSMNLIQFQRSGAVNYNGDLPISVKPF